MSADGIIAMLFFRLMGSLLVLFWVNVVLFCELLFGIALRDEIELQPVHCRVLFRRPNSIA